MSLSKKHKVLIFILLLYIKVYSQNEANNWYFGDHSGITFNAGVPSAITNSAIFTLEGCTTYSDSSGDLLFYSDGITVWDKNHGIMPNGIGLGGNPSSSQSGLFVPHPSNDDIFYLFTVGTNLTELGLPENAGFNYYTIDINENGGLGDIIGDSVNLSDGRDNEWSEKITSVQNTDCDGFWVISLVENSFYSYLVSDSGVSTIPIISNVSVFPFIDDDEIVIDPRGYLKVSPGGTKLVSANSVDGAFIFDFNATTGVVTNGRELEFESEDDISYGVEFSLNERYLYISTSNSGNSEIYQFEITSSSINDINESRNLIYSYVNHRGAIQLASNGKIYWAMNEMPFLSVINNPESSTSVGFQFQGVDLDGRNSTQGLPPFLQSIFVSDLDLVNDGTGILSTQLDLCHGETYTIGPDTTNFPSNAIFTWSFDGNELLIPDDTASLFIDEIGTYGAGFYELEVDFQDGECLHRGKVLVTYRDNPNLNPISTLVHCDDNGDGFSLINLENYNEVVIIDELTDQIFTYYESFTDAQNELDPVSIEYLTNDTNLFVRVVNRYGCFSIAQIVIDIQQPTITVFNSTILVCDDFKDENGFDNENNDDTDGISFFNFEDPDNDTSTIDSVIDNVLNLYPVIDRPNLSVHFYHSIQDGLFNENEILNINNYRNITSPFNERIYIRVIDNTGLSCPGFGENFYIDLQVIPIPEILLVEDDRTFIGCDENNDSLFEFDTSSLEFDILGSSQLNVSLTYFYNDGTEVVPASTPFPNPFITDSEFILVRASNNLLDDCNTEFFIHFIVGTLPISNSIPQQIFCDNGDDEQDGIASFDTSLIQDNILGGSNTQTNVIVTYRDEFLNLLSSPLPNPFETASQTISVLVENIDNSLCSTSTLIDFIVIDTPYFEVSDVILCLNDIEPNVTTVYIENQEGSYNYNWFQIIENQDVSIGSNSDFLEITSGGEYKVVATSTDGNFCQKTELFTVTESNIALLETVLVTDTTFSNSASIIVQVTGEGDYEYALDIVDINDDDEYQESNIFNFVSFGMHTITIRDRNNCGIITEDFVVLEYQKFFTPNDDGHFERWNINNVSGLFTNYNSVSDITIFNRYGKVMAIIDPNGEGWDGKFKGKQALPTDYWFILELIDFNGKIINKKGHFSLRL